jgi:hypothetical protein
MNLYLTTYIDDESATTKKNFTGTQSDASKMRVSLKKEGMRDIVTNDADVPTDKAGLMAYLNELVK